MLKEIYRLAKKPISALIYSRCGKVFCIGRNKTGTTSMAKLFKETGLSVGPQRPAELLVKEWAKNNFNGIIKYVKYSGVAFQDVPFSLPGTFKILDKEFPDSKFILTIRDSPEQWYNSLTTFHSKLFGNGNLPTKSDLQKARYVYTGWMWEMNRLIYNTPEDDIYNKTILIKHYNDYNNSVIEYFKNMPEKLLVVNLKEADALKNIGSFLNLNSLPEKIPWENRA